MDCGTCGAPGRRLRCPAKPKRGVRFEPVGPGGWLELQRCPTCAALWVCGRHEPHGAQRFWTLWPLDSVAWNRLRERPEGEALLGEWHDAVLRESWLDLPGKERAVVERWRERTQREHNAIDRRVAPRFLARSDDVVRHLDGEGAASGSAGPGSPLVS